MTCNLHRNKRKTIFSNLTQSGRGPFDGFTNLASAMGERQIKGAQAKKLNWDAIKSFIPNFTDSMSQLYSDSDDFNPELYNLLTDAEKKELMDNRMLASVGNPLSSIPFISLFQDTREASQEFFGQRNPELLTNAITRYVTKLQQENEAQAQAEAEAEAQAEVDLIKRIEANIERPEIQPTKLKPQMEEFISGKTTYITPEIQDEKTEKEKRQETYQPVPMTRNIEDFYRCFPGL